VADAVVLLVAAHAHQFDAQSGLPAAELAAQHARQQVADQRVAVGGGELHVSRRLAQRRVEAAPHVGAPRPAFDGLVDGDHRLEVVRPQGRIAICGDSTVWFMGALPGVVPMRLAGRAGRRSADNIVLGYRFS